MRRTFVAMTIVLFILGFAGIAMASNEATWNLNFEVLVEPRVEKAENGCTLPPGFLLNMIPQEYDEAETCIPFFEAFYSNVPTIITVTGNNPAGDQMPIPARAERHANGDDKDRYDRLSIILIIIKRVNEGDPDESQEAEGEVEFQSPTQDGPDAPSGAGWVGGANSMALPTPHDGEIEEYFLIIVDRLPPDCLENNEWYESADAGEYSFDITETVVGQDTAQSSDAY